MVTLTGGVELGLMEEELEVEDDDELELELVREELVLEEDEVELWLDELDDERQAPLWHPGPQ